jgi:predicted nucleic acid-binding protein
VIYIDSSVALAYVLAETRAPADNFWDSPLVSSRLLAYEVWNRLHARSMANSLGRGARALLTGIELVELSETVLARALEAWPTPVRTLDALHMATAEYLSRGDESIELATYENCLAAAAQAIGIPLAVL